MPDEGSSRGQPKEPCSNSASVVIQYLEGVVRKWRQNDAVQVQAEDGILVVVEGRVLEKSRARRKHPLGCDPADAMGR